MESHHANDSSHGSEMFGTPESQVYDAGPSSGDDEPTRSFFVRALYDYTADDSSSLSFEKGALIEVLTQLESGWWDGLLTSDIRGWFPSNYVEIISDEDAEMEMLARDGEVQLLSSEDDFARTRNEGQGKLDDFGGLGLDKDMDALRQLMAGHSPIMSTDAFEQLAESGMKDPSPDRDRSSRTSRQPTSSTRTRISDTSFTDSATTDFTSITARSNGNSLFEAEGTKSASAIPAIYTPALRPGPSERERMRSNTLEYSATTAGMLNVSSMEGRPRASTNAGPSQEGLTHLTLQKTKRENDFWVPRVSDRGDIYYLNTRTGAHAIDLPDGVETIVEPGQVSTSTSEEADEEDSASSERSFVRSLKSSPRTQPIGRPTSTIFANSNDGGRSRAVSDSRPSTANSQQAATFSNTSIRYKNAIEFMPDPLEVAFPWIPRASDDEKTYHYYNRLTHEISYDPHPLLNGAARGEHYDSTEEVLDLPRQGSRKTRAATLSSSEKSLPQLREDDFNSGPLSRYEDEREASELQQRMTTKSASLHFYLEEASTAITALASIVSEGIASDGLSEQDRTLMQPSTSTLKESSRLGLAVGHVVNCIRNLLYAAGSMAANASDLSIAAEVAWMSQEDASADALSSFQGIMTALHGKGALEAEPHIAMALQQSIAAPPIALTSLGKKINATLSKLVLSARSVIEQSNLNIGSSNRPELSRAQIEKIISYRQRIRDDSDELSRALNTFGAEAHRARAIPWTREVQGSLKSAVGIAGIGTKSFGGGSAAGWRGNGFVLPSATEAAALRAEASGSYINPFELTRDARNALSSGKISLRRKPTLPLSRQSIQALAPTFDHLSSEVVQCLQRESQIVSENITMEVKPILLVAGALLVSMEDIDLATHLDVDEVALEVADGKDSVKVGYAGLVTKAKQLVYDFTFVKQEMYNLSSLVVIQVQDVASQSTLDNAKQIAMTSLAELDRLAKQMKQILTDLVDVAEGQALKSSADRTLGHIGARAKVYGIDDVKLSAPKTKGSSRQPSDMARSLSAETDRQGEELADDVMYLGPGIAVPNGPSPGSAPAITNLKATPQGVGLRGRSTSVTTGTSNKSNDSAARISIRKEDEVKVNNKIKRFFGDDPSLRDSSSAAAETASLSSSITKPAGEEIPWFLEVDWPAGDVVFNAANQVKGATLTALLQRLTLHNSFDANFNTTFLMTYRSFTTTEDFLDHLSARFWIKEPAGVNEEEYQLWVNRKQMLIRFRIFNVLKAWLESHFYEGEDEIHLKRIEDFVLDGMGQSSILATPGKQLIRLLERRSGKGEPMVRKMQLPASTPAPIMPKNFRKIRFLDIDSLEMARQLTLIDSRLYNRIRPVECLNKAWSRENGAIIAKGIRDVIIGNNKISGWVSEAILGQEDLKKRAAWIKQFVAIADKCHSINNFSSMMAIYSGLNNAAINRLRRTWDAVNQRHLQMFENMKQLLAPTKNFSKYRENLRQLNPPCVPFLGVYLTDLTFIEDGNSDRLKTDERLINFSKRQMTADKIQEIMIYQSTPYNLTPVASIQKFIEENLIDSRKDEELFDQSLKLEPREREDEKIARLLQESGFL